MKEREILRSEEEEEEEGRKIVLTIVEAEFVKAFVLVPSM